MRTGKRNVKMDVFASGRRGQKDGRSFLVGGGEGNERFSLGRILYLQWEWLGKCVDVMRVHTEGLKIEMRWKDAIFLRLRKKICKAYSKYGSMCNKAPICICLKCAMRINHFNFFIIN